MSIGSRASLAGLLKSARELLNSSEASNSKSTRATVTKKNLATWYEAEGEEECEDEVPKPPQKEYCEEIPVSTPKRSLSRCPRGKRKRWTKAMSAKLVDRISMKMKVKWIRSRRLKKRMR